MFEKHGFKKVDLRESIRQPDNEYLMSTKIFAIGGRQVSTVRIFKRNGKMYRVLISTPSRNGSLEFDLYHTKVTSKNRKFIETLIEKGKVTHVASIAQKPIEPRASGNWKMQSPAKWILAQLDSNYAIDDFHLQELIKRRDIIPLSSISRKKLEKSYPRALKLTAAELKQTYLVPMHLPGDIDNPTSKDDFHQRVITTVDEAYNFKGVGLRSSVLGRWLLKKQGKNYEVPLGVFARSKGAYGGLQLREVKDTYRIYKKLEDGWNKLRDEEPEVARQLGVHEEIPFAKPVVVFQPLEIPARDVTNVTNSKLTSLPVEDLSNEEYGGVKPFKNLRIMCVKNPGGNMRLRELNYLGSLGKFPEEYRVGRKRARISLPAHGAHSDIVRAVQGKMLAAIYIGRKYAGLAMHKTRGNKVINDMLHPKDFTFSGFTDTNHLSPATPENLNWDLKLLHDLDKKCKLFPREASQPIQQHPLYEHVIRGI